MHLEIAANDLLIYMKEDFLQLQIDWKEEIKEQLQQIKCEGSHMPQLEEELIRRRRDELRHAQDVREHYEKKLERANNLYMELTACMLQLEKRERELVKREQAIQVYAQMYNKRQKSILKPILKAQQRIERMSKKRAHKCISDPGTSPDGPVPNGITLAVEEMQQPSPSRSRSRKNRHRRSNSRGSNNFPNNSSGVRSPTKEALHNELESKRVASHHQDGSNVTPSSLKHLSHQDCCLHDSELNHRNLNDVCFGCDGGCSDATCSSKRSSRVSADVESNTCDTCEISSPSTAMESSCEQPRLLPRKREGGEEVRMDDSTNMNHTSIQELDENKDSENGNSMSDSQVNEVVSPTSGKESPGNHSKQRPKRLLSNGDGQEEQQPSKMLHNGEQCEDEDADEERDQVLRIAPASDMRHLRRSGRALDDSWSECDIEDSEEDMRHRKNRATYSRFSSEGALSEEENTSERSRQNTPDHMLSSLSTENLQLELTAHCGSDGLSDKESIVQRMKQVVKHSPERALSNVQDTDSSDSDGCSTVSTAVHKPRSLDKVNW